MCIKDFSDIIDKYLNKEISYDEYVELFNHREKLLSKTKPNQTFININF